MHYLLTHGYNSITHIPMSRHHISNVTARGQIFNMILNIHKVSSVCRVNQILMLACGRPFD